MSSLFGAPPPVLGKRSKPPENDGDSSGGEEDVETPVTGSRRQKAQERLTDMKTRTLLKLKKIEERKEKCANDDPKEQNTRTVFISNLPPDNATKIKAYVKTVCSKFLTNDEWVIESIRLRGAISADEDVPMAKAFAANQLHEKLTSIYCYVRFNHRDAAVHTVNELRSTSHSALKHFDRHWSVDMADNSLPIKKKCTVFVGNLSFDCTDEQLWQHFNTTVSPLEEGEGVVQHVRIIRDRATGAGKGFAYVAFVNDSHAVAACRLHDQTELGGRRLRIQPCRSAGVGKGKDDQQLTNEEETTKQKKKKDKHVKRKKLQEEYRAQGKEYHRPRPDAKTPDSNSSTVATVKAVKPKVSTPAGKSKVPPTAMAKHSYGLNPGNSWASVPTSLRQGRSKKEIRQKKFMKRRAVNKRQQATTIRKPSAATNGQSQHTGKPVKRFNHSNKPGGRGNTTARPKHFKGNGANRFNHNNTKKKDSTKTM